MSGGCSSCSRTTELDRRGPIVPSGFWEKNFWVTLANFRRTRSSGKPSFAIGRRRSSRSARTSLELQRHERERPVARPDAGEQRGLQVLARVDRGQDLRRLDAGPREEDDLLRRRACRRRRRRPRARTRSESTPQPQVSSGIWPANALGRGRAGDRRELQVERRSPGWAGMVGVSLRSADARRRTLWSGAVVMGDLPGSRASLMSTRSPLDPRRGHRRATVPRLRRRRPSPAPRPRRRGRSAAAAGAARCGGSRSGRTPSCRRTTCR